MDVIPGNVLPYPAQCASCFTGHRDCVDFQVNVRNYGAVLLCLSCFRNLVENAIPGEYVKAELLKEREEEVQTLLIQLGSIEADTRKKVKDEILSHIFSENPSQSSSFVAELKNIGEKAASK